MLKALRKIFGSKHEKDVKALRPLVEEINRHFESLATLTDEQLVAKTVEFRGRISEELKETEDQLAALRSQLSR